MSAPDFQILYSNTCDPHLLNSALRALHLPLGWEEHTSSILKNLSDPQECSFCALSLSPSRALLGYISVKSDSSKIGVDFLAVVKKGHGIGTALLKQVILEAEKKEIAKVELSCRETIKPFYEKFGERHQLTTLIKKGSYYANRERQFVISYSHFYQIKILSASSLYDIEESRRQLDRLHAAMEWEKTKTLPFCSASRVFVDSEDLSLPFSID